jgi:hypothetical protein
MAITSNNTLQVDEINIKLTPFLKRALPLARLGIRVFPCDVRGKEPAKPEGLPPTFEIALPIGTDQNQGLRAVKLD